MHLNGVFSDLGPICVQDKARIINELVADGGKLKENAKVMWDKRTGAFHLIFLRALPKLVDPDPDFNQKCIVATDPGCRPFQSWYSPTTGQHGVVLAGMEDKIKTRRRALDVRERRVARRKAEDKRVRDAPVSRKRRLRLVSAILRAKARAHTTLRMTKRLARERVRFANWMEAAHYDAANFLLRNHDLVIQPKLNTRHLIQEAPTPEIAQRYRDWSHFKFRQRLQSASARYAGRHVLETTEPGTSRTCTHCGFWKADLAVTDKIFRCPNCALCVDRQLAGARNNFFAAYGMAVGVGWDGIVVGGG
jgi:transposase